jgi:hypothetical protein
MTDSATRPCDPLTTSAGRDDIPAHRILVPARVVRTACFERPDLVVQSRHPVAYMIDRQVEVSL